MYKLYINMVDKNIKRQYDLNRNRSKLGMVRVIYNHQRLSSRRRSHPMPDYSVNELFKWCNNHAEFNSLYEGWVNSGYETSHRPSIDRLNDYLPYTLNNIRLITWNSHRRKSYLDRKNGINNKVNVSVTQYNINGIPIETYHSVREAERVTGIAHQNIVECCKRNIKQSGGFKWAYTNK